MLAKLAGFVAVWLAVYFTVPYAWPGAQFTLIQSAAITVLAFLLGFVAQPPEINVMMVKQSENGEESE